MESFWKAELATRGERDGASAAWFCSTAQIQRQAATRRERPALSTSWGSLVRAQYRPFRSLVPLRGAASPRRSRFSSRRCRTRVSRLTSRDLGPRAAVASRARPLGLLAPDLD